MAAKKSLKNQTLRKKSALHNLAAMSNEFQNEVKAEIEEVNVKDLPEELQQRVIYVKDENLFDDPLNKEYYGELEVKELAETMKAYGFQGVILAYPHGEGQYMIESGHRRRLAARMAGLKEYPVFETTAPKFEWERSLRLIGANLHNRPELSPMATANLAQSLYEAHEAEIKYKKDNGLLKEGEVTALNELVARDLEMTSKNIEKYRRLLNLNEALQKMADGDKYPWSYLSEASNLSQEKQNELVYFICEKEESGKATGSANWIKDIIRNLKLDADVEKIEETKEPEQKSGRIRRKNGTKIVLKTARDLHEVLDKDALFKKEEIPSVLNTLENLKTSIEKKIEELNTKM